MVKREVLRLPAPVGHDPERDARPATPCPRPPCAAAGSARRPANVTRTGRIACTPCPGTSFIARKSKPCVHVGGDDRLDVRRDRVAVGRQPVVERAGVGRLQLHRLVRADDLLRDDGDRDAAAAAAATAAADAAPPLVGVLRAAAGSGRARRRSGVETVVVVTPVEGVEQDVGAEADRHLARDGQDPRERRRRPRVLDLVVERRLRRGDGEDHAVRGDGVLGLGGRAEVAAAGRGALLADEGHRGDCREREKDDRTTHGSRLHPGPEHAVGHGVTA